jgi:hypothetical protein
MSDCIAVECKAYAFFSQPRSHRIGLDQGVGAKFAMACAKIPSTLFVGRDDLMYASVQLERTTLT